MVPFHDARSHDARALHYDDADIRDEAVRGARSEVLRGAGSVGVPRGGVVVGVHAGDAGAWPNGPRHKLDESSFEAVLDDGIVVEVDGGVA